MLQVVAAWVGIAAGVIAVVGGIAGPKSRRYLILTWRAAKAQTIGRGKKQRGALLCENYQLRQQLAERDQQERERNNVLARRETRLHNLTPEEQVILRVYIEGQTRTQSFIMSDGVVRGLEHEHILFRPVEYFQMGLPCAFDIQPWAYTYLENHLELVGMMPQGAQ